MKKIIIHTVPVLVSFIWLILVNHTVDPITLRGQYFLKFYLILLFGFYISVFSLKLFDEAISKITFYFTISIFILGIAKLVRGVALGKPIGFLTMILMLELIVILIINSINLNKTMK